jgi:hypothetical protein
MIRLQILQAQLAAQRGLQQAYDARQRMEKQAADNRAFAADIESAIYGRDAIDVEVREVPDVLRINAPPPRAMGDTTKAEND